MLILNPITFALRAVQMQIAKSKSAKPPRNEQQGVDGTPIVKLNIPSSTLEHTPSLRVSRGHEVVDGVGGVGIGVGGVGFGVGGRGGIGVGQFAPEETIANMRMFSARKSALGEPFFGAISKTFVYVSS